MLKVVKQLFHQMNENIKYVHFKSNEHLSEGLNGETDLDLLIFEQDKGKLKKILNTVCFVPVMSAKEQEYNEVEHWLGFDDESGKLVHLHIYYKLITGKAYVKEIILNWNEIAYEASEIYSDGENEVRIVSPEFEMILLLTRIFYKASFRQRILYNINFKKHIPEDAMREYDFLRERISGKKFTMVFARMFAQINDIAINAILKYISENSLCDLYKSIKEIITVEAGRGNRTFTYRGHLI